MIKFAVKAACPEGITVFIEFSKQFRFFSQQLKPVHSFSAHKSKQVLNTQGLYMSFPLSYTNTFPE